MGRDALQLNLVSRQIRSGRLELLVCPECEWVDFSRYAQHVVDHFQMTVERVVVESHYECLWIANLGSSKFSISWDWDFREVTLKSWGDTSDDVLLKLLVER